MHDVLFRHPAVSLGSIGNVPCSVPDRDIEGYHFQYIWGTLFQYILGFEINILDYAPKNDLPLGLCPRGMENCTLYSLLQYVGRSFGSTIIKYEDLGR